MSPDLLIVFVCEHGAAKSVIAAAYFNRFARDAGLSLHAVARGTNPDQELSRVAVMGLQADGLAPTESVPQKLLPEEVESAQRLITFCELPHEHMEKTVVERWDSIPPVSENYEKARDVIIERVRDLLNK